jgi:hypothetical protein
MANTPGHGTNIMIFRLLPFPVLVDVNITADNAYEFAFGDASGINQTVHGPVNNVLSAEIFSCGLPGAEHYGAVPVSSAGDFMYIVAINDNQVTQGLLGQITVNGGPTVFTGTRAWQAYDTGISGSPGAFPSVATINGYIAAANAGTGPASGSKGWVNSAGAVTAGAVGALAIGEDNSSPGGDFGIACQFGPSGLNPAARWMWYNPNPGSDPFPSDNTPGHAANFMIFRRTPCTDINVCGAAGDGTSCEDGNPCTQLDTCQSGTCTGANPLVCAASDQCHVAGTCSMATGVCSSPAKANGSVCNDSNPCTQADACQSGACAGSVVPEGTACSGGVCHAGACTPVAVVVPALSAAGLALLML